MKDILQSTLILYLKLYIVIKVIRFKEEIKTFYAIFITHGFCFLILKYQI